MNSYVGLWPRGKPRPTDSNAEKKLFEALRTGLPSGWSAWHSLRSRTRYGIEGEGDFVIAIPERGLLVLEVKGGFIEVRDGHWFQNGRELKSSPREQGERFVRTLLDRLSVQGAEPPAFGVATCFPDVDYDDPPTQDNLGARVLGRQDLVSLSRRLPAIVEAAMPPARSSTGDWIGILHRMWGETWTPQVSLGRRAQVEEERRVALDRAQTELVLGLAGNPTLLVEGGAGSGKTLLAREAAQRLADTGARVALLCFTAPLARWLREAVDPSVIRVSTVRALAVEFIKKAGFDVGRLQDADEWEDASLRAALDAIPLLGEQFDAVIVDEAQDFSAADWAVVEELTRGGKRLWAFTDPAQAFWPDRPIPREKFGAHFKLTTRHRCPPAVCEFADAYNGQPPNIAALLQAVEESTIGVVDCPTADSVAAKIATEIDKLLGEGLRPDDLAIVSLRGLSHPNVFARRTQIGRHTLVRADSADMAEHIVADTFLRMKGLERPAVIVTDLGPPDATNRSTRVHIALTRALLTVRVVAAREEILADPVLAGLLRKKV